MTVTENDILNNAAAIASLVNSVSSKTIADLDAVTSLAAANFLHVSVSGVDKKITRDNALKIEGTEVLSTGETGGNKFLREDGDDSSSWQGVEGTDVLSTGETGGTKFLREDGDGTCSWQAPTGGGGSTEMNPMYAAGSFDYPASNMAPLDTDSGANGTIKRQLFDDTTDETVIGQFKVPSDIDTSGTVTFKLYGYPSTAAADDVVFVFSHSVGNNDETWDAAFTDESSGAKTCINTQDDISIFTWTETVSNLGWAASDFCRFKLTRDADNVSDTLSGDFGVIFFEVDIPRA